MFKLLNRKVSTTAGVTIIMLVALISGWFMISEYKGLIESRYQISEIKYGK